MYQKIKSMLKNLCLAAMFVAIGLVLPFVTGQVPKFGSMLLPMHIPVLLCGLICGWRYGLMVGFLLPPLRFVLFGMPPIFPTGMAMAFELATYGLLAGLLYSRSRWKCIIALYRCLIAAMVGGRVVWGAAMVVLTGLSGSTFGWAVFMSGAFFNAIPGIVLQLTVIPAVMVALDKTGMVRFHHEHRHQSRV